MRGALKGLTTPFLVIAFGLLVLVVALPALQSASEKANQTGAAVSAINVHSSHHQDSGTPAVGHHGMLMAMAVNDDRYRVVEGLTEDQVAVIVGRSWMHDEAVAQVQEWERQARSQGREFNPYAMTSGGQRAMLQNEQLASIMVQQHPGDKEGYCIDGDELPEVMPEGSETGCTCGAHCDEDGKPVEGENTKCKRYCKRDKCKCGTCL